MKCDAVGPVLEAYVDGEMEALRAVEVERHLAGCAACRGMKEQMVGLQVQIRKGATYHKAPAALLAQVEAMVEEKGGAARRRLVFPWRAMAIAASVMLMMSLGWLTFARRGGTGAGDILAAEVLSAHLRSLQANHLSDVVSSDQHTVRPWFAGKLDFAPPVKDFKEQGFVLLGGRLDYVEGRPVAALVYQRRNHLINVFLWPVTGGDSAPEARLVRGYHLLKCVREGMEFYLVSDMDEGALEDLEQMLPAKT